MASTLRDEIMDVVNSQIDPSPETDDLIDLLCYAIIKFITKQTE